MARKFGLISRDELKEKIDQIIDFNLGDRYFYPELTPQVAKDIKCRFDCENLETAPYRKKDRLLGYNTLDNGLTFLGIWAGGDWEIPVFFIIYWDGKKLRGYVPTNGNPWNTDTKMAYGNSVYKSLKDGENIKKRWPKAFKNLTVEECNDIAQYDSIDFDYDAIEEDIRKRIIRR